MVRGLGTITDGDLIRNPVQKGPLFGLSSRHSAGGRETQNQDLTGSPTSASSNCVDGTGKWALLRPCSRGRSRTEQRDTVGADVRALVACLADLVHELAVPV